MLRYIIQRLLQLIPILIGISVLTFLMLHLIPGDPVLIFAGDKPMTEERAAEIRHQLGLDRPLWVQYGDYAAHAVRGDLGRGLRSQRPVLDSILEVAPGTTQLTLAALALATLLGMTLGILAALARGTWLDTAAMTFAILGGAVVTETIFSRPGVGRLAVDAILSRDFPLVQGTVLFTAVAYVLVNLLVDISYAAVDPRVRYQDE